jgi:hypothetical protein
MQGCKNTLMEENRNIIFIGHASPEDDDFTIWLASRLQLLGYEVWIDKEQLLGGEKFWQDIDLIIRNKAIKYLLVYSKNICQKDDNNVPIPGKLKDGVSKEFNLADSIAKQNKLNDFIILLNIDGSDYNLFIDAPRLNQIPFFGNWADGFNQLLKKLKKDKITKDNNAIDSNFGDWYSNKYLHINNVERKNEPLLYYSNWWEIKLPEYLFLYKLENEEQAREISFQQNDFPMTRIGSTISSFEEYERFEITYQEKQLSIYPVGIYRIAVNDILMGIDSINYPTQKDCENNLKYLLNRVFHIIMKNRGLFWYEMANKKKAYFYTFESLSKGKVHFSYPYVSEKSKYKYKWKNIIGEYSTLGNWHYAISSKVILAPIIAYSIKGHLTFTDDGKNLWKLPDGEINKVKIHSNRRKKGRGFFNEHWRDMMLAFLYGLRMNDKIELPLSNKYTLKMSQYPYCLWTDYDYLEPREIERQSMFVDDEDDEEEDFEEITGGNDV